LLPPDVIFIYDQIVPNSVRSASETAEGAYKHSPLAGKQGLCFWSERKRGRDLGRWRGQRNGKKRGD